MSGCIVANNYYPLGSEIILGGEKCKVLDRMNSRYGADKFDKYFRHDVAAARQWGVKELLVEKSS